MSIVQKQQLVKSDSKIDFSKKLYKKVDLTVTQPVYHIIVSFVILFLHNQNSFIKKSPLLQINFDSYHAHYPKINENFFVK